ncbi:hypothetical protein SSPS47_31495 [Streptomyces sp. S4.7]|uniref:DUF6777 domain-containing protein n=1 Tax=Streptomyces sp. S4.7 TaxID=2705439 RepID=UPI0013994E1C|nr:DUF6777 domain-containing protein [Streptomyces sp. S4.7]QHY99627.1 hypothetical protein SSPS47_31495 [Streptomyces sp. S4.7]
MECLSIRPRHAALAVLSAGILIIAGCGEDGVGKDSRAAKAANAASAKVLLQPFAAPGPAPFTESTAAPLPDATPSVPPSPSAPAEPSAPGERAQAVRSVSGATAGLYGGTKSLTSCDVDAQVRLLTADPGKATAFARGAGVGAASVPNFLRGLTPVVLRADVRLTSHGYRGGAAAAHQAVLQSGTAVLVDDRGLPRVRCAGGNPLRPAVAPRSDVVRQGEPWSGYRPDRVVVVNRSTRVLTALLIVAGDEWIERRTGTDGDQDKKPDVPPPYSPDTDIIDPSVEPPDPTGTTPGTPEPDAPRSDPAPSPDCLTPDAPEPDEPENMAVPSDCPSATPTGEPDGGVDPDYPVMPMSPEREGSGPTLDGGPGALSDDGLTPSVPGDDPAGPLTFQG